MKITIDTKEDSITDIQKAISFLESFVQNTDSQGTTQYTPAQPEQKVQPITDFTSIFGEQPKPQEKVEQKKESDDDTFKILPY